MGKTPTLKGSILREFLLYYERRFGADALRAIAADLPAEVASKLDVSRPALGILPSQSYPCAEVYPIIEAICAGWSRPDFRAFVREAADESLGGLARGVYRFIAETIVSPALLVRAMPRIWTLIHSTGARRARLLDAGSAEVIIEGWAGHHPLICELTSETSAGSSATSAAATSPRSARAACPRARRCARPSSAGSPDGLDGGGAAGLP